MLTKRIKVIVIVCLSLGIAATACVLSFTRITSLLTVMEIGSKGQAPIKSLMLRIEKSQREELFEQFHKFADKHGFEVVISDYGTGFESYVVEMLRDDIQIAAIHSRPDPQLVSIAFYDQRRATPTPSETIEAINELAVDLEDFISQIPNVTITEEK